MAIHLPATVAEIQLVDNAFARGSAIASGEAVADLKYGARGLHSIGNVAYAQRIQQGASFWSTDWSPVISENTTTGWETLLSVSPYHIGADVVGVYAWAYIKNGTVRVRTNTGAGWTTASTAAIGAAFALASATHTLASSAGLVTRVQLQYTRTAGQTFEVIGCGWHETSLTAGDIP